MSLNVMLLMRPVWCIDGARRRRQLIERMFLPTLKNSLLEARHDGAILPLHLLTGSQVLQCQKQKDIPVGMSFLWVGQVVAQEYSPSGQTVMPLLWAARHSSRSNVAIVIGVSKVSCQINADAKCSAS